MTATAVSTDAPTQAHVHAALERLVYLSARDCEAAERRSSRRWEQDDRHSLA